MPPVPTRLPLTYRTSTQLADGRELIYYDESPMRRATGDARPLEPSRPAAHLRYDPLLDEWVTITAHRNGRTMLPSASDCPLCPTRDGRLSEIPADDYDVVVFENRFPAFARAAEPVPGRIDGEELFARRAGHGRCEVVCFTSQHTGSFAGLSARRARTVVEVWTDRTAALNELPEVDQVYCFENRGEDIGVTLHHPHGQIYGYPFRTPRTQRMVDSVRRHRAATGGDLFADLLAAEKRSARRVVLAGEHWTAFVPAAARWPVEVHLYPHRPVPDFVALTDEERDELADVYLRLLRGCDRYYATELPYVAGWHQAPSSARGDLRLHLQLFSVRRAPGKVKYLAGSESGMSAWINDVEPEAIAERLRAVVETGPAG